MKKEDAAHRTRGTGKDRLVSAARRLFFTQGFASVTTDQLVAEAGVSKATLYKHFGGLTEVLQAVVLREVDGFETGVERHPESRADWINAIVDFGSNLLAFLNTADARRLDRLMLEEARSHPQVAKLFFETAYLQTDARLRTLLQSGADRGWLPENTRAGDLSEQLAGMWRGNRYPRAQFGLTDKPFGKPRAWAKRCVDALLGQ